MLQIACCVITAVMLTSAYVGPGAGLGMLGSLLAVLAAVLIGLFGLVLYPVSLLRRIWRAKAAARVAASAAGVAAAVGPK